MDFVISAPELNNRLSDDNIVIVDTRSFSRYGVGHIPGAVNIELMQFHWIDTSREGIAQFNRQTAKLISNIGVGREKFVVFYDEISGPSAARGVWLLLYMSHTYVAMLNGGFRNWKKAGFQIETATNPFYRAEFNGRPNKAVLADWHAVKTGLNSKKDSRTVIIDSRSKSEYIGKIIRAARAGHIPKSINIDWNENVREGSFKPVDELARLYARVPKDAKIITYCQGGYRAANTFVALRGLGYKNVQVYLGSWGEWGNRFDLPVDQ